MIDLPKNDLKLILEILKNHIPEYPVFAFGSRVSGRAKAWSDLDLAIDAAAPVPLGRLGRLREALEESPVSIRVEILDLARTARHFRDSIASECEVLQEGTKSQASLATSSPPPA